MLVTTCMSLARLAFSLPPGDMCSLYTVSVFVRLATVKMMWCPNVEMHDARCEKLTFRK